MPGFDDREKTFESKWAHDEELAFKVMARRNKLLGLWAADLIGLKGADADAYAKDVISADFEEAGHEDVFRKVKGDLDAKGLDVSEHHVRKRMQDLLEDAYAQVLEEKKK
jgi:hypothetical protein